MKQSKKNNAETHFYLNQPQYTESGLGSSKIDRLSHENNSVARLTTQ